MDGSVVTPLVMSLARVAPLKRVSLPRLELLGSLLAARLLRFVCRALRLPAETPYQCWTDSMVVLGWIKGDPCRWKQFVRNRVTEIHSLTDPALWAHCPGLDNPADLITRGVHAEALTDSCWFSGPNWLKADADVSVPSELDVPSELGHSAEAEAQLAAEAEDQQAAVAEGQLAAVAVTTDSSSGPVFQVERFSSLTKAIRVVGLVLRFIRRLKAGRASGREGRDPHALSYVELSEAKVCLIKAVQSQEYLFICLFVYLP